MFVYLLTGFDKCLSLFTEGNSLSIVSVKLERILHGCLPHDFDNKHLFFDIDKTMLRISCSYLRLSECVMEWWYSAPVVQVKLIVSTSWWKQWRIVGHHTEKWEWTPKPSLHLKCLDDWMSLLMTGPTVSFRHYGGRRFVLRKVCTPRTESR